MSQTQIVLNHCIVHVSDWERANAFNQDVMGAEVLQKGDAWVYQFGPVRLNVHGPGVEAHPVARVPVPRAAVTSAASGREAWRARSSIWNSTVWQSNSALCRAAALAVKA